MVLANTAIVIIPSWNTEPWTEKCLRSVLEQTYQDLGIIFIDDHSDDQTFKIAQSVLADRKDTIAISRPERWLAMKNWDSAIRELCSNPDSVIFQLDGDDWLACPTAIAEMMEQHQTADVVWSKYVSTDGKPCCCGPLKNDDMRNHPWVTSHLRSFKKFLFDAIKPKDFLDKDGKMYEMNCDQAIMVPILEMTPSNRRKFYDKVLYTYNRDNPINDDKTHSPDEGWRITCHIRLRKPYSHHPRLYKPNAAGGHVTLETSKAYRRRFSPEPAYQNIFKGTGIDIGGGTDPLRADWFPQVESVRNFDLQDGNAQTITEVVKDQFDFVYSSNCLEHMEKPQEALAEWWKLVKPKGHLVVIVPDEDLYEQGVWPSRWNGGHKWTFTTWKKKSWSPKSINMVELWRGLPGCSLVHVKMADFGWDETLRGMDQTVPPDGAEAFIELVVKKEKARNTLTELAEASMYSDKRQLDYAPFYDLVFGPRKKTVKKILEIGIYGGDSLRMWRDFFPNAKVYGWDIVPDYIFQETRIETQIMDHDDKAKVLAALEAIGHDIDIIIDDGSHQVDAQQRLLAWCLPYVANGGLYVTEDLHTSTLPGQFGLRDGGKNGTYQMYVGLQSNGNVESEYLTDQEKGYIRGVTGRVLLSGSPGRVSQPFRSAMLAVVFKK